MVSQSVIFNASPSSIAFSVGTGSALHHVWRQHARARRNIQSYGVSSENKWVLQQHGAYQTRWMLERRGVNLTANTCRWYLTKHCGLCRSKQTTWFFFLFFIHSCIFVRAVLYVTVACMLETHIWIYTCRNTSRLANIHTHTSSILLSRLCMLNHSRSFSNTYTRTQPARAHWHACTYT